MSKVLIGVLALLLVIAMIPVTVIALSAPSSPPAMASMAGPLSRVNFEDVPTPQRFQGRDGARLQYYAYPAAQDKVAVLVHGSVGPGKGMHALAKALRDAGVSTYVLDIRGHGGSGRRGDIDYIGQIDDDLDDFVTSLGPARPDQVRTLVGFSAGAGFTIRFAGRPLRRAVRPLRVPLADPAGSTHLASKRWWLDKHFNSACRHHRCAR